MADAFDTLRAAKRLKGLGFPEEQAEGLADMLREIVDRRGDPERGLGVQPVPAGATPPPRRGRRRGRILLFVTLFVCGSVLILLFLGG